MTYQDIFNILSQIECDLYYRNDRSPDALSEQAHQIINKALMDFHNLTGCINE